MVRRLVDEQPARVALVAVPAAEVVRAVAGVEQPLEVHGGDLADDPLFEQALDLGVARGVAVVEGHAVVPARRLLGVDDLLALSGVDGHRLFADDVAAEFHGAAAVDVVGAVHAGDYHHVGLGDGDHLIEAVAREGRHVGVALAVDFEELAVVVLHAPRIDVADADELRAVAVGEAHRLDVHGSAIAGADQSVTGLSHGEFSLILW